MNTTIWSRDPRAHAAVFKPPCGRAACRLLCMTWWRCRCGANVGRCVEHAAAEPLAKLRAEHRCADRRAA